jgi:hypothetical protein
MAALNNEIAIADGVPISLLKVALQYLPHVLMAAENAASGRLQ